MRCIQSLMLLRRQRERERDRVLFDVGFMAPVTDLPSLLTDVKRLKFA